MQDGGKIIAGLVIFLGLMTYTFWSNLGATYEPVEFEFEGACIEDKEWMAANHMILLNEWRHSVVRDGNRLYYSSLGEHKGKPFEMSLQNTCVGSECHVQNGEALGYEKFCSECHTQQNVSPYCWTCHIAPEAMRNE